MSFIADKQTLSDLNLLGKYKPDSMFSLFNQVCTAGGERLLQEMFQFPLQQADQINERSSLFKYFEEKNLDFPLAADIFSRAENYLGMDPAGNYVAAVAGMLYKKVLGSFLHDEQFRIIHTGLIAAIEVLNQLRDFLEKLEDKNLMRDLQEISDPEALDNNTEKRQNSRAGSSENTDNPYEKE
ncbi:MAG TPA: hypothetical protein VGC08_03860, partial [Pedobacter sp.]